MPLGLRRTVLALIALPVSSLALGVASADAAPAPQCRQQVIQDWSDNGRIDRVYPLRCYEQAMRTMPPEIRDYSDAPEVIDRALTLAVRRRGGMRQDALPTVRAVAASATHTAETTAIPTSLFVLGALALSALTLGGVGYYVGHRATSGRRGAAR